MNFFAALARVGWRISPIMEQSCGNCHIRVYFNARAVELLCDTLSNKHLASNEWRTETLLLNPTDYVNIVVEYHKKVGEPEYIDGLEALIKSLEL